MELYIFLFGTANPVAVLSAELRLVFSASYPLLNGGLTFQESIFFTNQEQFDSDTVKTCRSVEIEPCMSRAITGVEAPFLNEKGVARSTISEKGVSDFLKSIMPIKKKG